MSEHDETVSDDVTWYVDPDGTEWFVEDGVRYELADDGYAYAVEDDVLEPDIAPEAAEDTDEVPTVEPAKVPAEEQGAGTGDPTEIVRIDSGARPASPFSRDAAQRRESGPAPGGAVILTISEPPPASGSEGAAAASRATSPATASDGATGDADALLRLSAVRSGYGHLPVLHGVDLEIRAGETLVLFGLNGAGKTTTALNICGALRPWGGTIDYEGVNIARWGTHKCVNAGIVMVPEGRRVFPELSVRRNLQIGAWSQRQDGDWVDAQRERVLAYFPQLRERTSQLAGTLSGGEQQMLALARGLMARPRLLIVDEASMGLAPVIVHDVFEIVRQINRDGVTVLLIEQNVGALEVADAAMVMEQGRIVRELRGEALRDRETVSEAVMGE